ncbi:hypothetical protein [[Mycoplasma] gypis]|uniref:Uncharacterized protein n=1 Tax=[Mycoplasma] gypis TaxID=92404 RepID=A0ABZ2RQF4_9BACT|nr:hypothetical protein [[Mycoplasma] gypis]MBN0919614.1 hypothetical protein [[Mycoplasma] gypis]
MRRIAKRNLNKQENKELDEQIIKYFESIDKNIKIQKKRIERSCEGLNTRDFSQIIEVDAFFDSFFGPKKAWFITPWTVLQALFWVCLSAMMKSHKAILRY